MRFGNVEDFDIKLALALHPFTPPEIIKKLDFDGDSDVEMQFFLDHCQINGLFLMFMKWKNVLMMRIIHLLNLRLRNSLKS